MPTIKLPANGWQPRDYQERLWRYLEGGGTRAVAIWHRRAGKDDVCLHWTAVAAFQRPGTYWHMLPEASQARKAIWNAVNPHTGRRRIDEAFPEPLRKRTNDQEMFIEFVNGSTWQVVGSDNYNSLVGAPPVGVVFSEWALADPASWAYIRPILLENGGWAFFITTPRGRNHAASFYFGTQDDPAWFAERLTAHDTSVFTQQQLDRERAEYIREYGPDDGEARFRQEYLCDFEAAIPGAYYGRRMAEADDEGRVTGVPWEPAALVHTAWDLGVGDSTAIWFAQLVGREVHVIDYYESSGVGLDHYVRELKSRKYVYGDHWLPHDVKQREMTSGRTRLEALQGLMAGETVRIAPNVSVDEGIHAVRNLLPRCWFDKRKCERGIEALRQYRREWDDKNKAFRQRPLHDWTSHASDAMRYLAVSLPDMSAGFDPDEFEAIHDDRSAITGY